MNEPARIRHYELLSRLGEGGMGVVYRARDTRLGRTVALKMLHGSVASDEERARRFEREARILSAMSHPGIATIYDFDREGDSAFLAMELVEGPTLRQMLESGPLPVDGALDCAIQVAEALAAAHRAGIVHRDLKPENIMAASSGYYKVLDFGVARMDLGGDGAGGTQVETVSWATSAGELVGTVSYMSPEQALGRPVDARSDLFSFGSLLYEIVTGVPAFRGTNAIATANAVIHEQPPAPSTLVPGLPPDVDLIVAACHAKDPADRYASADDAIRDLRLVRESGARRGGVRGLVAERRGARRRTGMRTALAVATAIVATLVVLGTAAVVLERGRVPGPDGSRVIPAVPVAPGAPVEAAAEGRRRVVVAEFENRTGDPDAEWLGDGLAEMLTTDLSRSDAIEVIATQRLRDLLAAAGRESTHGLDESSAAELARWAGADVVVSGSVYRSNDVFRIDAQAYDTDTGTVLTAQKVEGTDPFPLVANLAEALRSSLAPGSGAEPPPASPTLSAEALRLYTAGRQAWDALRWQDSAELFERAVAADPGFALARLARIRALEATDRTAEATDELRDLAPWVDRLPDHDRRVAEALDALLLRHDVAAALTDLRQIAARFPQDPSTYVLWARILDRDGDPLAAAGKLREALGRDPTYLPALVALADQVARLGSPAAAAQLLRDAATQQPQAAPALAPRIERYAADGKPS